MKTLQKLEKGELNHPYEFIHIYCRHFLIDPNLFIKTFNINCHTINDKLEYIKLYYGVRNSKKVDAILGTYKGAITDFLTKGRNKNLHKLIEQKYYEIKKK